MTIPFFGIYNKSLINDEYFRIIIRNNCENTRGELHKNHEVSYTIRIRTLSKWKSYNHLKL